MTQAYGSTRSDRFNAAARYAPVQPKKKSFFRRFCKAVVLTTVMVAGFFGIFNRPGTDIAPPPQDDVEVTQPVEQQKPHAAPEPEQLSQYFSKLAGKPDISRELTPGEAKLARSIFGDKLDLRGMRVHEFNKEQRNLASDVGAGETKNIEFYGKRYYAEDFSKAANRNVFGSFMHEMMQIYQNQTGIRHGDVEGFNYPLGSQWRFTDYGPEQQRAIVEDYAMRFLHPDRASHWTRMDYTDKSDTDPFLIRLVEDQFPAARAARIAFQNIDSRPMTPGEAEIIKGIFGDQIDVSIVRQNIHPQSYDDIAGTATSSRDANYWGPRYGSKDYSKEKNPEKFGTFVHENTHVWQFQTNWRYSPGRDGVYKYPLESKWKFTDYTHEQQAAMVEDYALYYLHPSKEMRWLPQVYSGRELREKLPMLKSMVENQFPGAKKLREAYEAKQTTRAQVSQSPAPANAYQWKSAPVAAAG
jgi:hypothetical protein